MNISSFLFSFLVLTNAVFAQQTDSNTQAEPELIEEVIVSGQYVQRLDLDSENSTGSRLGLTSFETPATIDVIDSVTMTMRGFKSVTEAAESLPGVLSGEAPGEPSSFPCAAFNKIKSRSCAMACVRVRIT